MPRVTPGTVVETKVWPPLPWVRTVSTSRPRWSLRGVERERVVRREERRPVGVEEVALEVVGHRRDVGARDVRRVEPLERVPDRLHRGRVRRGSHGVGRVRRRARRGAPGPHPARAAARSGGRRSPGASPDDHAVDEGRDEGVVARPAVLAEEVGQEHVDEATARRARPPRAGPSAALLLARGVRRCRCRPGWSWRRRPSTPLVPRQRVGDVPGERDVAVDQLVVGGTVDPGDVDHRVDVGDQLGQAVPVGATDRHDLVVGGRVDAAAQVPAEEALGPGQQDPHARSSGSAAISGMVRSSATVCSTSSGGTESEE